MPLPHGLVKCNHISVRYHTCAPLTTHHDDNGYGVTNEEVDDDGDSLTGHNNGDGGDGAMGDTNFKNGDGANGNKVDDDGMAAAQRRMTTMTMTTAQGDTLTLMMSMDINNNDINESDDASLTTSTISDKGDNRNRDDGKDACAMKAMTSAHW